jgi:hypothetical protein
MAERQLSSFAVLRLEKPTQKFSAHDEKVESREHAKDRDENGSA